MGNLARQRVWHADQPKGNERMLLLALADFIPDDGWQCWPSIETLKDMVGVSDRQVQRMLKNLEAAGHLAIAAGRGRTHTSRYALLVGLSAAERASVVTQLKGDIAMSPNTGETPGKGDNKHDIAMSPFNAGKGDISEEKVTSGVIKGDIAMSPEPKEPNKEPRDERSSRKRAAAPRQPDVIFESLADACGIDWHICTQPQRDQLNQSAGILRKSGGKAGKSEAEIADTVRYVAGWFRKNDWRGKRGERPTPAQIREVWGAAIAARPTVNGTNGYHPPQPPPIPAEDLATPDEWEQFRKSVRTNREP